MKRNDFKGVPETGKGEAVRLIGVSYDDQSDRKRVEDRLDRKYDLELFDTPSLTVICKGDVEEVDAALGSIEETLNGDNQTHGEVYVFEEEDQVPDSGFTQLDDGVFAYEESYPQSGRGEVEVGANSYFMSRNDLEPEQGGATDGQNYVEWDVDGGEVPRASLRFEGSEGFAGTHSKAFSVWMGDALDT
jgi:hypothetical protein|nr:MAG: hypothetical protein J07AB56_06070 [Candidatus Nanosalinarum sp. J07AB56]